MADNNTTSNLTSVANVVEIRGPVYNGSDILAILATQGTNGVITMDANNFATFYYDIDQNVTNETLTFK